MSNILKSPLYKSIAIFVNYYEIIFPEVFTNADGRKCFYDLKEEIEKDKFLMNYPEESVYDNLSDAEKAICNRIREGEVVDISGMNENLIAYCEGYNHKILISLPEVDHLVLLCSMFHQNDYIRITPLKASLTDADLKRPVSVMHLDNFYKLYMQNNVAFKSGKPKPTPDQLDIMLATLDAYIENNDQESFEASLEQYHQSFFITAPVFAERAKKFKDSQSLVCRWLQENCWKHDPECNI